MEISAVLRLLKRGLRVIFLSALIMMVSAALLAFQLTPLYKAEVRLTLDVRHKKIFAERTVEAVVSELPAEVAAVRTEIDIITSRSMAQRVVDRLGLMNSPEFLPPPSSLSSLWFWLNPTTWPWLRWFGQEAHGVEPAPDEEVELRRAAIVDQLIRRLDVKTAPQSYTIFLEFSWSNPRLASLIANTYADLYLVDQLEAKFEATRQANAWLSERLEALREQVRRAERAAAIFRERSSIIQTSGSTIAGQQLLELNSQLVLAQSERAQAEARLRSAQDAARTPDLMPGLADVLNSSLIQRLREQETTVRRREAEMSSRYGPAHPTMINARAELKDVREKIKEEIQKVIQGLNNQLNVSRAKERTLEKSLSELEQKSASALKDEVQVRELDREADSSRVLYESFLNRFKETTEQQGMQQPDSRIISRAETPKSPFFPRKSLFVAGGGLLGALLGIFAVLLREHMLRGIYNLEQAELLTGYSGVAVLPSIPRLRGSRPEDHVLSKPTSAFSEALRIAYTAVQFSNIDHPPKVILVTSALPGEGKTTFCVSLARLLAAGGRKVLLIDADLRRPNATRSLQDNGSAGLSDLVRSDLDFDELIQKDTRSGADYVIARAGNPNPQDLLGSQRVKRFIQQMALRYDLVIIDTPPVMAVADVAPLARIADTTMFLVRWGETPRETVLEALGRLTSYSPRLAGIALTRVDMKRYAAYGTDYREYCDYYAA